MVKSKRQIALIAHNLRSTHNVGSILRSADGFGASVYLTGYTPYPFHNKDKRMPHLAAKINRRIAKTALGAEKTVNWLFRENISEAITKLKSDGFTVVALEQTKNSVALPAFKPPSKIAIIVGSEIGGIEPAVLKQADRAIEIPMLGQKESLNAAVAAAIAMCHCRFV